MTRIALAFFAGLLGLSMVTPSSAADFSRPAYKAQPYFVAPFSWSGLYIGINGGYGWGTSDWSSVVTAASPKPKGALLGATLGYNIQTGALVYGLEADIDYSWMKDTAVGTGACVAPGCETRDRWLGTGRGRLGYAFDRWLPYITGGVAVGDVRMTPTAGGTETKTKVGYTLGGGVEYAFSAAWSVKAEYLYVDLGTSTCSAATCGIDTDVKYKANLVKGGLNWRF